MNVITCQNGHFFDGDKFPVCPHCGAAAGGNTAKEPEKVTKRGLSLFGRKNKTEEKAAPAPASAVSSETYQQMPVTSDPVPQQSTPEQVEFMANPGYVEQINNRAKSGKTLDFWQTAPVNAEPDQGSVPLVEDIFQASQQIAATQQAGQRQAAPESSVPVQPVEPVHTPQPVISEPAKQDSLREAIQRASASTEGKTVGVFSMGNAAPAVSSASAPVSAAASPAASAQMNDGPVDPVVGWLVCIHGKHFGESFNLAAGKNSIGRSTSNRIVLWKDNSVSREKHAMVIYEPKKRNFYVQPGDSSGLTYLNDDYITESKRLAEKDILEIGDCQFIFIPLCGEQFTWEDYISKE